MLTRPTDFASPCRDQGSRLAVKAAEARPATTSDTVRQKPLGIVKQDVERFGFSVEIKSEDSTGRFHADL
ncbi:MAG: hypothetical protein WEC79_02535 [Thermomicrobiales bacterium]